LDGARVPQRFWRTRRRVRKDTTRTSKGFATVTGYFGGDESCFGGPGSGFSNLPAALFRGGYFHNDGIARVFAMLATNDPSGSDRSIGFRCAR